MPPGAITIDRRWSAWDGASSPFTPADIVSVARIPMTIGAVRLNAQDITAVSLTVPARALQAGDPVRRSVGRRFYEEAKS
jgi:hypothetical protein